MEPLAKNRKWSNEVHIDGWFEWFTRQQQTEKNKALEMAKLNNMDGNIALEMIK